MPFVSITHLRVRSWKYFPIFLLQALRAASQAAKSEGNTTTRLLKEDRNTFWTLSCWSSEKSMKTFILAGTHGAVMRKLLEWCDEAALVHWSQESSDPPSWEEAHRRLQQDGRVSKVNNPSPAQNTFSVPAPNSRSGKELRFR